MISIIIPCYNEQDVLKILYNALIDVAKKIRQEEFSFLFIDDGSKDNTLNIIKDLSRNDNRVKYISFSRNFGKEAAIYAGFSNVEGDYVAVMDADMQDPPELLISMYDYITNEGYDCVATRRIDRNGEPLIRSFFAKIFYKIINKISDIDIVDGARDFRLMTNNVARAIVSIGEYNRFTKGIYGWIGFKTKWIPYKNVERVAGETKWDFWKLFKYSLSGIVNFSEFPLIVSSIFGVLLCLISFFAIIFIIIRRLTFGDPVSGWASLVCIIMFIGGIQLLCIGIIGQYLAKVYLETKKRPIYIIKDKKL